MNKFEYVWPVKVYFGENTVKEKLESELKNWGRNIMLAYGGGSIKKNGIYDYGGIKAGGQECGRI